MNDLVLMGVIQCISDLRCDPYGFIDLQRGAFFDDFVQVLTFNVFHDDVMDFVFLSDIVHADDIRVRQGSGRLRLPAETPDKFLVVHKLLTQHFDGHVAVQQKVLRLVYQRHAPSADPFDNLITTAQFVSDHEFHSFMPDPASSCCSSRATLMLSSPPAFNASWSKRSARSCNPRSPFPSVRIICSGVT
ncbi:hypothetical protein D3C74_210210 [compost metagenome]